MGATTSVLAPKQQQANKSKASKTKRLKKCKKSSAASWQRSEVLLQEVQQRHLVVLPRLGAADAVSLVGVDLELVRLPCPDQLGHEEVCVEKVDILIQEAM